MPDLDMSPYAAFVWPAWGLSALVLAALAVRALTASRKWKRELARLEATGELTERPQVPQGAVGQENRPQVARSALGQEKK